MNHLTLLLIAISAVVLMSHRPAAVPPKLPPNFWSYSYYNLKADSSAWVNLNQVEISFMKRDGSTGKVTKNIALSFTKWPIDTGTYYTSSYRDSASEITIIACDKEHCYISTNNREAVYVTREKGKLHFWANYIALEELEMPGKAPNAGGRTAFSFNLLEF